RVGLAAGLHDAGQAIMNMELLAALPRPTGFFDPNNPSDLPPSRLREKPEQDDAEAAVDDDEDSEDERAPLLSFSNTDMAFAGDLLFAGSYHGFNVYDVSGDGIPELLTSVVCPGGQGDVSVVGDLLIMSVEQTRGRLDCGLQGAAGTVNEARFRGLRIFDISDISMPMQVGAVQTCRGSHTHTVVAGPGEDGRLIVYNSGTASVRDEEELEGCIDESPWKDERTALFRIDVIEIPVDRPWDARIIDSPAVFADPETGALAGLWEGGDHGDESQETNETNHCHDITVFPELNIAAGACSGNGIIFDISDPLNPQRIDEVVDSGFAYWHSATFNNDGTKVLFTDEWGGGSRARCRASDPLHWGANAIYDIVDGKLEFRSYYKMPAPQTDKENCVAHNGSIIPVPGRDIFVQAWYQGGISVMDFTDSSNPVEIAFFDRGPIDEEDLVTGGYWSVYWHRDKVYGTEIVRGLDTLALEPSEYLSANEIAAASMTVNAELFNPQQQHRLHWKHDPVVARAWIDQLVRTESLAEGRVRELESALTRTEQILHQGASDSGLAAELDRLAEAASLQSGQSSGRGASRLAGLAETLQGIAERLRRG
ncbi:MAG: LVIVD repeat-containing protein, partial [Wenzhouxiangellaceae bacterium]